MIFLKNTYKVENYYFMKINGLVDNRRNSKKNR